MQEGNQNESTQEQFDLTVHAEANFGEHRSAGWG